MKSTFERHLFGTNQYSVINEEYDRIEACCNKYDRFLTICEDYYSEAVGLEETCKRAGLQEEYSKYENGDISREELETVLEGLFGALGRGISSIQKAWNSGVQDFKDARMAGKLDAQNRRFNDIQRQRQMILQNREKRRLMREDPSQFTTVGTSNAALDDTASTAQQGAVNAATAHTANVQRQDIDDSRQAALAAGTDLNGDKPLEAQEAELKGMMAHDPENVDYALNQIQTLMARLNTTTDENEKADLLNQIYQASAAGAKQVSGRLDARVQGSKGGQTTRMKDGRNNNLAVPGRRNQPPAGRIRGGRGARMP